MRPASVNIGAEILRTPVSPGLSTGLWLITHVLNAFLDYCVSYRLQLGPTPTSSSTWRRIFLRPVVGSKLEEVTALKEEEP